MTKIVTVAHGSCSELRREVTEEYLKEHARRIGKAYLQSFEYLDVVEDDELTMDVTEDDMLEIHRLISTGEVVVD